MSQNPCVNVDKAPVDVSRDPVIIWNPPGFDTQLSSDKLCEVGTNNGYNLYNQTLTEVKVKAFCHIW